MNFCQNCKHKYKTAEEEPCDICSKFNRFEKGAPEVELLNMVKKDIDEVKDFFDINGSLYVRYSEIMTAINSRIKALKEEGES